MSTVLKQAVLPILLVIIALVSSWYVIEYPSDSLVERYVSVKKIVESSLELLYLCGISMALAIVTSVSLGIIFTRPHLEKAAPAVLAFVNICQAVPSLAVIAIVFSFLGIGAKTAIIALWVYSLLPILNNTITGIRGVEPAVKDAAKGLGMSNMQIFLRVELPLAFTPIVAGIRTSLILNIGSAVVAAYVGAGGLGNFIIAGKAVNRMQLLFLGGGLTALIALFIDSILAIAEEKIGQKMGLEKYYRKGVNANEN